MNSSRPRAVVVALNNLAHDTRVLAEAATLHEAGYEVTAVGIVQTARDAREELAPFGRIVRVLTSERALARTTLAPEAPGPATTSSTSRPTFVDDARVFLGRLREDRLISQAIEPMQPDVAIVCDLNALPIGSRLRRSGTAVVYDVHELWTDQGGNDGPLFRVLFRAQERLLIGRMGAVVTVNTELARVLSERYRLTARPLVVFNGPSECLPPGPDVGTPLRMIVQGTFGADRGLDELLDSMQSLRGTAHLTLRGYGALEGHLKQRVDAERLSDVVLVEPPCSPDQTVACAAGYDVGVVSTEPRCLNSELSTPNRLFAYMGAGLCILSSNLPAVRAIVESAGCGVGLEVFDGVHIAEAVQGLAADPDRVAEMKRRASAACVEFSWANQAKVLLAAVEQARASREAAYA